MSSTHKNPELIPRPGAVRYFKHQDVIAANPGDLMFSTVTMSATEYWAGTEWKPIFDEGEEDGS
jgi:hypothetical protein